MGARRLYRAATNINSADLPVFDIVQSFDVLYMVHENYDPIKVERTGHTEWTFGNIVFGTTTDTPTGLAVTVNDPNQDSAGDPVGNAFHPQTDKYVVTAIDTDTGQESLPSTPVSAFNDLTLKRNSNDLTWGAVTNASAYHVYKSHNGADYGRIAVTTDPAFVDDNAEIDFTIGPPSGRNPFSGDGNKPSSICFFEQRLCFARSRNNPNAAWLSRSGDFENMDVSIPLRADDAITIRLVSQGVNEAYQLVPTDKLRIFGSDGIWEIEGANEDYLSAAPPPRQRRVTTQACSRLEPITIGSKTLYKTRNGQQVRAAGYRFEIDGVASDDVTIFSPDFFEGFDVICWTYAEEPLSVVWAARSDGNLLAFTWQEEQQVWGWTECPLPNDGKVRSLTTVRENGEDRVYAIITFTIAGVERTVRCRMVSARWWGLEYANHLDCSVTRENDPPSAVVTGLWHLEGAEVAAFADGRLFEGLTVEDGQVTLPTEVALAHVGLPYDALMKTLPLDLEGRQGSRQQTGQAVIRLTRSLQPEVGVDDEKMRTLKIRHEDRPLLSGLFAIATDPKTRLESDVTVRIRSAPLTVTAIYLDATATGD